MITNIITCIADDDTITVERAGQQIRIVFTDKDMDTEYLFTISRLQADNTQMQIYDLLYGHVKSEDVVHASSR